MKHQCDSAEFRVSYEGKVNAVGKAVNAKIEQVQEKLFGLLSDKIEDFVVPPTNAVFTDRWDESNRMLRFTSVPGRLTALTDPTF